MAFAFLQLGPAHRSIGRDGEDQVINLGLASVVLGKCLEADDGILLVLHQHEGAGADGFLVDLLRAASLQHGNRVFLGLHTGPLHGHVGKEGCFWFVQGELDGQVVQFVDRFQQGGHAHVAKVSMVGTGDLEVRVIFFPLALDGEQDVIGIQVARWLEVFVGLPLHTLAQFEGVLQSVFGHGPAFGQTWHNLGAATLEFNNVAVDLLGDIERCTRGVYASIKILGATL